MEKVKTEGVITVEELKGTDTTVEVVEGISLTEDTCLHISLLMQTKWKPN